MNYGFVKVASATPKIKVADCEYNKNEVCKILDEAVGKNVQMIVFPELCLTGYTCSDLFLQKVMLRKAKEEVMNIAKYIKEKDIIAIVGLPFEYNGKLYNVAAVLHKGEVLGIVPKTYIPNYSEFYEARHFSKGIEKPVKIEFEGKETLFGTRIIFKCKNIENFTFAIEICEDVWSPLPPSVNHALAGAIIIANLSASNESTGKDLYRSSLITGQSARLYCGYIYSDSGEGESTTDLVYSAHNMISENGTMLAESERFKNQTIYADMDLDRLTSERRKTTTFYDMREASDYENVYFEIDEKIIKKYIIERKFDPTPFVPASQIDRNKRCEEILSIQALGLKKRLEHTNAKCCVVGISGGLDSTLALIVTVRAFDLLGLDRKNILAVTMPGFGTTDRTYSNALELIKSLGATLKEINISEAVNLHFKEIEQDSDIHDATYENSQARQRTMLLMNLANKNGGLVVGTGDMSELALGWATYNGDHMSMYGVNASVPKTLVRHLVKYYADICGEETLNKILLDVLDTPVSPELLPPKDGLISQKTEDLVGPYELHDFFLYYVLRFGYEPKKILKLAVIAFENIYDLDTINKWLKTFYSRFFSQQFKRSCLPDGPKVGSVAVSPRGDLRMPSDACVKAWIEELQ